MMECPECGLACPDATIRCDCGHAFYGGPIVKHILQSEGMMDRAQTHHKRKFGDLLVAISMLVLYWIILAAVLSDRDGVVSFIAAGAATVLSVFLWRQFRPQR